MAVERWGRAGRRRPVLGPLVLVSLVWVGGLVHASATSPEPPLPLGAPAPAPPGDGGYGFMLESAPGVPIAFDPCQVVRWVLRPDGEPAGGREVVEAAVAEVSRATGLQFAFDGLTDEAPRADRPRRLPESYGDRWAPVLVAWSTAEEAPALAEAQVGSGVASWADDGTPHLVSGQLLLDREDLVERDGRLGPLAAATALHELAHVVGLGHVDDEAQLMNPVLSGPPVFGDGDLRGLHRLGLGTCDPV
jgi:hypothetical protein